MRRRYPTFGFSDDHTVSGLGNEKMAATMRGGGTTSIDIDVLNSSAAMSPRAPLSPRASLRAANTNTMGRSKTDRMGLGPASSSETGNGSGNGLSSGSGSGRADSNNNNNNNNNNYLTAMLSSAAGGVQRIGTQLARDWQDEVEKDKAKRA